MAQYQEVDYCSEEVRSVGNQAGGGMQQQVVKETFMQEIDRSGCHGHHGHRGHHAYGSGGHLEVRETKVEEDVNTCTGEFHERKENFVIRAD